MLNQRRTNSEKLQQRNRLATVSKKTTVGLRPVLLARKLALNFDAALDYKYIFSRHMGPLPHLGFHM